MRIYLQRGVLFAAFLGLVVLVPGTGCSEDTTLKVSRLSRNSGSPGESINIYGSGFQSGGRKDVRVFFGSKKADVLGFKGNGQLTVKVPGGVEFGKTVDVKVVFEPGGELTLKGKDGAGFTYRMPVEHNPEELLGGGKDKK